MLEDCQLDLAKVFYNKNLSESFWKLFEHIYYTLLANPKDDVGSLFGKLDISIMEMCPNFNPLSMKYFIAIIKEGIQV